MDNSTELDSKNLAYFEAFKAAKKLLVSEAGGPADIAHQVIVTGKKGRASMPIHHPEDLSGVIATLKRVTGNVQEFVALLDTFAAVETPGDTASAKERFEAGDVQATEALTAVVFDGQKFITSCWPYRYDTEGFIVDNGDGFTRIVNGGPFAEAIIRCF